MSFAVGGLLGDVFLHSLPEIFANEAAKNGKNVFILSRVAYMKWYKELLKHFSLRKR